MIIASTAMHIIHHVLQRYKEEYFYTVRTAYFADILTYLQAQPGFCFFFTSPRFVCIIIKESVVACNGNHTF